MELAGPLGHSPHLFEAYLEAYFDILSQIENNLITWHN